MNLRAILLKCLFIALLLPVVVAVKAQSVDPAILNKQWKARWIGVPGEDDKAYGVYYFRKQVQLAAKPASLVIHVSADNRYKLFVNEKLVSLGPARGDITHWNYETIDIAPYVVAGKNTVAAQVWNEGDWRPEAQISLKTGFIIQGADTDAEILNTDISWKCTRDTSYKPLALTTPNYHVAGSGELVDMKANVRGWEKKDFNDEGWKAAKFLSYGIPKNINGEDVSTNAWLLIPSIIPPMELTYQRLSKVRRHSANIK
ncbi:MAG: alpha-rhamnosidase, partial [Sphingobacteriaceae bacterium]